MFFLLELDGDFFASGIDQVRSHFFEQLVSHEWLGGRLFLGGKVGGGDEQGEDGEDELHLNAELVAGDGA